MDCDLKDWLINLLYVPHILFDILVIFVYSEVFQKNFVDLKDFLIYTLITCVYWYV